MSNEEKREIEIIAADAFYTLKTIKHQELETIKERAYDIVYKAYVYGKAKGSQERWNA